jgi:anti-anti-sigma factor
LFAQEIIEDTLVITVLTENIGFADQQLSNELNQINHQLDHPEIRHVLVDFSRITFFSSTLLEALRKVWLRVKDQGGRMVLCCVTPGGQEILHLSRFDTLWRILPDRAQALAELHLEK